MNYSSWSQAVKIVGVLVLNLIGSILLSKICGMRSNQFDVAMLHFLLFVCMLEV